VTDRYIPARNRCLWHAGGAAGENDHAPARVRRLPAQPEGEACPRCPRRRGQEPGGLAAAGWETRTLARLLKGAWWRLRWRSDLRVLSSLGDRFVPAILPTCWLRVYPTSTGGLRSRSVTDAHGALVLRDQGPIGLPCPAGQTIKAWASQPTTEQPGLTTPHRPVGVM
jgi:hypothetical protein